MAKTFYPSTHKQEQWSDMIKEIKGVIFDFHGTLGCKKKSWDSRKLTRLLRKDGCKVYHQEWEAAHRFVSMVEFPRANGKIDSYESFSKRILELLGIKPSRELVKKAAEYWRNSDRYALYPDVRCIRKISAKKAILTTTPLFRFRHLDLRGFDPVMTGIEIGRAKPHPDGLLKILRKWKLKPKDVLMVGDDDDVDITPARELGIKTVFIGRDGRKSVKADCNIRSLRELEKIIRIIG